MAADAAEIDARRAAGDPAGALALAQAAIAARPGDAAILARLVDLALALRDPGAAVAGVEAFAPVERTAATLHHRGAVLAAALVRAGQTAAGLALWNGVRARTAPHAAAVARDWKAPDEPGTFVKQRLFRAALGSGAADAPLAMAAALALPGEPDRADLLRAACTMPLPDALVDSLAAGGTIADPLLRAAVLGLQSTDPGVSRQALATLVPAVLGGTADAHLTKATITLAKWVHARAVLVDCARRWLSGATIDPLIANEWRDALDAAGEIGATDVLQAALRRLEDELGQQDREATRTGMNGAVTAAMFAYRDDLVAPLLGRVASHSPDQTIIAGSLNAARHTADNRGLWQAARRAAIRLQHGEAAERAAVHLIIWRGLTVNHAPARDGGGVIVMNERRNTRLMMEAVVRLLDGAGLSWSVSVNFGDRVHPGDLGGHALVIGAHTYIAEPLPHPVLHVKEGPLRGTFRFDPGGYLGWSAACDRPFDEIRAEFAAASRARAWVTAERERLRAGHISKILQKDDVPLALQRRTRHVFLALQTPGFYPITAHMPFDFFAGVEAVARAHAAAGHGVLVKRHPGCKDPRVARLLNRLVADGVAQVTQASIHTILPQVDAVCVVNSGVGAEALLYDLPVHVMGRVDYQHACHRVTDLAAIDVSDAAFTKPLGEDQVRYVHWYATRHHLWIPEGADLDAALAERLSPLLARLHQPGEWTETIEACR